MKSVFAQSYSNIEYLVIDGGSTDGSLELIKQWSSQVHQWISEPDAGIYDAMNKAVRIASGEWIIFMNAGDRFSDASVVADMFSASHDDADLVYGHSLIWYARERVERFVRAEPIAALPLRMKCSHQSLFARRWLLVARPFSVGEMASDYEFLVRMQADRRRFKLVDRVVSVCANGGISDTNRLGSLLHMWKVSTRYGLTPRWGLLSFLGIGLRDVSARLLKSILPQRLTAWILQRKRT
jgi:glycosyltransferase involved in cell wall biosynthesis